ncbi:hypothetical protein GCM10023322_63740 [Rugosimonospora acidiphila]|uniref:Secreted protein n=1 Tax=Rugosimonospora acidiphila TaxID=556531 RepID=A0ABP9SGJ6_9ACTN
MVPDEITGCWMKASSALGCTTAGRVERNAVAALAAWAWTAAVLVGDGGEAWTATAVPTVASPTASAPAAIAKRGVNFKGAPFPRRRGSPLLRAPAPELVK